MKPAPAGEAPFFRRGLLGLMGFAALSQALIQRQAYGSNPVVRVPGSDAAVIWERAGEIAAGEWVDTMPLETAPLPLWMAAGVRSFGGGLAAFGVLQSLLYLLTALLVALVGRELGRLWVKTAGGDGAPRPDAVALVAGALFVVCDEPAAGTSRVLAGTSQLFLVALVLWLTLRVDGRLSRRRGAGIGLATGVLCLSYPPFLAAIPLLGFWLWKTIDRTAALLGVSLAALAISPATLHNYQAAGEWIPISSQAGLTFYHGNNVNAQGVIAPTGVVGEKRAQAAQSLALAKEALGANAGWVDAGRYWRGEGLRWWAESPGRATGVAFRKLWYAFSGRRYGDVYQPWRERNDGTAYWLWLAPLPLAWVLPLAFMTILAGLARRKLWVQWAPIALFFGVPMAVCVVFFYTPRYRLPASIVVLPLAALAVVGAAQRRTDGRVRPAAATALALGLGIVAGPINRHYGFDTDTTGAYTKRHFLSMANGAGVKGDNVGVAMYLGKLLAALPGEVTTRHELAHHCFQRLGDGRRALEVLDGVPPEFAMDVELALLRARIQSTGRTPDVLNPGAALAVVDSMIQALGAEPQFLDVRAAALARLGRFDEAVVASELALSALTPDHPARKALLDRLTLYRAGFPFTQPMPASTQ